MMPLRFRFNFPQFCGQITKNGTVPQSSNFNRTGALFIFTGECDLRGSFAFRDGPLSAAIVRQNPLPLSGV